MTVTTEIKVVCKWDEDDKIKMMESHIKKEDGWIKSEYTSAIFYTKATTVIIE